MAEGLIYNNGPRPNAITESLKYSWPKASYFHCRKLHISVAESLKKSWPKALYNHAQRPNFSLPNKTRWNPRDGPLVPNNFISLNARFADPCFGPTLNWIQCWRAGRLAMFVLLVWTAIIDFAIANLDFQEKVWISESWLFDPSWTLGRSKFVVGTSVRLGSLTLKCYGGELLPVVVAEGLHLVGILKGTCWRRCLRICRLFNRNYNFLKKE